MKYDLIGKRFDRLKLIHRGQWAVSYQAFDAMRGRYVFLKIIPPAFHQDGEILARFHREVEIAGKIDHPNVVKLIDSGEIGDSLFIAFEWLKGKPLDFFIKDTAHQNGNSRPCSNAVLDSLPVKVVLNYIKQMFSGLAAIHQAGIIHRDLKPNNILLDESGTIHILDFSLSYAADNLNITPHEHIVGTPGYLAPEVVAGAEASKSSDLFAAGVITYELLTNTALFTAKDIYTTLQMVHQAEVANITKIRQDVPPALWTVIKKLLAKHPYDRYTDCIDVLDDLDEIVITDSAVLRKEHWRKSHRWFFSRIIVRAALIFIALLSVGMLITFKSVFQAFPQAAHPDSSVIIASSENMDANDSTAAIGETNNPEENPVQPPVLDQRQKTPSPAVKKNPSIIPDNNNSAFSIIPKARAPQESTISEKIPETIVPDSVHIFFNVFPWSKVYCRGNYLGTTPFLREKTLLNKNLRIRFEHPDFPPLVKEYSVVITDTLKIELDLTAEFGRLDFAVEPWAYLIIDDLEKGTLPRAKPLYLPPGEHIIRLKHPDFPEMVELVSVSPGQTLVIEKRFSP